MQYTKNNHLKIPENKFGMGHFEYGHCTRDLKSFKEEVFNTAKLLAEELKNEKIRLCYSGGVDSHVMLISFLELEIVDFTVAIAQYSYGSQKFINEHETKFAIDFCNQHYVDYKIYHIDLKSLWNPINLVKLTDPWTCNNPAYATHIWLVSEIVNDGYAPIFGLGVTALKYDKQANQYYQFRQFGTISLYNFFLKNNIKGTPFFHNYTPEHILSFINNLTCKANFAKNQIQTGMGKLYAYSRHFNVPQKNVFNGLEVIAKERAKTYRFLRNRYGRRDWEILLTDLLKVLEKPK